MPIDPQAIGRIRRIYDARANIPFNGSSYVEEVRKDIAFLSEVFKNSGSKICEIGCGRGWHIAEMARNGYRNLTGIDISSEAIRKAKDNINKSYPDIKFIVQEVSRWKVHSCFDGIFSILPCVGQYGSKGDLAFLASVAGLLKHRGVFVFSIFCEETVRKLVGHYHVRYSDNDPTVTQTTVEYNEETSYLAIKQKIVFRDREQEIPPETMRLYSGEQLRGLGLRGGFSSVDIVKPTSESCEERVWLLAHK